MSEAATKGKKPSKKLAKSKTKAETQILSGDGGAKPVVKEEDQLREEINLLQIQQIKSLKMKKVFDKNLHQFKPGGIEHEKLTQQIAQFEKEVKERAARISQIEARLNPSKAERGDSAKREASSKAERSAATVNEVLFVFDCGTFYKFFPTRIGAVRRVTVQKWRTVEALFSELVVFFGCSTSVMKLDVASDKQCDVKDKLNMYDLRQLTFSVGGNAVHFMWELSLQEQEDVLRQIDAGSFSVEPAKSPEKVKSKAEAPRKPPPKREVKETPKQEPKKAAEHAKKSSLDQMFADLAAIQGEPLAVSPVTEDSESLEDLLKKKTVLERESSAWTECKDSESGDTYYYDKANDDSSWDPPNSVKELKDVRLSIAKILGDTGKYVGSKAFLARRKDVSERAAKWECMNDPESDGVYYFNESAKETQWEMPADLVEKAEIVNEEELRRELDIDGKVKAKASFAYDARSHEELTMEAGDVLLILDIDEEGWCVAELKGKKGVVPSTFLELS